MSKEFLEQFDLLQKRIFDNKVRKGFNTTDVHQDLCFAMKELGEVCDSYWQKKENIGEEIADVVIFMMGLAEMLGVDLGEEVLKKIEKNDMREYVVEDGVMKRVRTEIDP